MGYYARYSLLRVEPADARELLIAEIVVAVEHDVFVQQTSQFNVEALVPGVMRAKDVNIVEIRCVGEDGWSADYVFTRSGDRVRLDSYYPLALTRPASATNTKENV